MSERQYSKQQRQQRRVRTAHDCALVSTSGVVMAARKTTVMKEIVHCLDLDLWVGDGCAEDQATDAVEAMIPMLVGGS